MSYDLITQSLNHIEDEEKRHISYDTVFYQLFDDHVELSKLESFVDTLEGKERPGSSS